MDTTGDIHIPNSIVPFMGVVVGLHLPAVVIVPTTRLYTFVCGRFIVLLNIDAHLREETLQKFSEAVFVLTDMECPQVMAATHI